MIGRYHDAESTIGAVAGLARRPAGELITKYKDGFVVAGDLPSATWTGAHRWRLQMGSADPSISVVMAIHNGEDVVDRALRSILGQEFTRWELLAIDDGSTDGTSDILKCWSRKDGRIRVLECRERRGLGAARNVGLRASAGNIISYIDSTDEYLPGYLNALAGLRDKADVLISAYEIISDGAVAGIPSSGHWDPCSNRIALFTSMSNLFIPLCVAHRRDLALRLGGFNENLWCNEHGDLWKRLARAGAEFIYIRSQCGRHYSTRKNPSAAYGVSVQQRLAAETSFKQRGPLYPTSFGAAERVRDAKRVLFASAHSVLDFSNGAAIASMDLLKSLGAAGFECQAFCSPMLDIEANVLERIIQELGDPYEIRPTVCGGRRGRILFTRRANVPITLAGYDRTYGHLPDGEYRALLLEYFHQFLNKFQPDVVLTYGGDPITQGMIAFCKRRDIPVVFAIHNFAYKYLHSFWDVDYCVVPSDFAREYYWRAVGLFCHSVPNAIDWSRVRCVSRSPQYVTFVNPSLGKGACVFARIAIELLRRRPDIKLLVVESRSTRDTLAGCGLELDANSNVTFMAHTADSRRFLSVSRLIIMPSLVWENQPLVAIEAMINGIPVVGSTRGGLPEALGDAGLLLALPDRLNPESGMLPTSDEVGTWVDAIIRLWDDEAFFREQSSKAYREAARWHPDRLRSLWSDFFRSVYPQPGPPFLPVDRAPTSG